MVMSEIPLPNEVTESFSANPENVASMPVNAAKNPESMEVKLAMLAGMYIDRVDSVLEKVGMEQMANLTENQAEDDLETQ